MEEAFRRIAFNVMAANCDDHSKNVSFLLREGGAWELAPAYDVTHAYNPKGEWTYQHLMSVNGKFSDITRDDLMVVADQLRHRHRVAGDGTGCRSRFLVAGVCQESRGECAGGQAHPRASCDQLN